jgi:hypothetical protein
VRRLDALGMHHSDLKQRENSVKTGLIGVKRALIGVNRR